LLARAADYSRVVTAALKGRDRDEGAVLSPILGGDKNSQGRLSRRTVDKETFF